jgi:predicted transcriptional regulator
MTTKSHHRCEIEIAASILRCVDVKPKRKTLIMNAVNLNHRVLEKHLARLLNAGFLVQIGDVYELTEGGRTFLEDFGEFRQIEAVLTDGGMEDVKGE